MTYLWVLSKDGLPADSDQTVRPLALCSAAEPGLAHQGSGRAQSAAALQVQILLQPLPAAVHVLLGTRDHLQKRQEWRREKWGEQGKESSHLEGSVSE